MRLTKELVLACVTVVLSGMNASLQVDAQGPAPTPPNTTITVPEMHCMGCAKKMAVELYKVQGIGKVLANVEVTTMTVKTKDNQAASPRAIWEAIERAGYQPTRLDGPGGVFTSKPKS